MNHRNLNKQNVQFEFKNIKRLIEVDKKKLDYDKMTDEEIANLCAREVSFKVFETQNDRQFAKRALDKKL